MTQLLALISSFCPYARPYYGCPFCPPSRGWWATFAAAKTFASKTSGGLQYRFIILAL
ncbi:MAG: hypothetical protein ABFS56_17020 [Pseudomonadota bacterium]